MYGNTRLIDEPRTFDMSKEMNNDDILDRNGNDIVRINLSEEATDIKDFLSFDKFDPLSLSNNPFAFPIGIWSSPEAAYYGLSSQQARDMGFDAGEGIALYSECLRGLVFNPNGLLKLIFDRSNGRIIGVHICGDDACELIHYGMELVRAQRTVYDVINNLFSAVTYHEMYRIASLAAIDEAGARKRRAAAGAALAARNRSKGKLV
jgi:NAD(P) transhydrogenase